MTTDAPDTDFETLYKAAVSSADLSVVSRGAANSVIDRLFESRNTAQAADLTRRIQEAASQGDSESIFALTDELRSVKKTESERNARLIKLADEFSLMDVLRAFPAFRSLAFELGLLVLQKTEEGLKHYKKPARVRPASSTPKGTVYLISHNGETIEAIKNVGAARLPGAEVEFFEFFGFDISPDGRLLDPPTFTNIKGEVVPANSKKAIIDDLLAGNRHWKERGYSIRIKDSTTA